MNRQKTKKLYRKANTNARWQQDYAEGGEFRWKRHSKSAKQDIEDEISHQKMKRTKRQRNYGQFDYRPLLNFLLKQVGRDVDDVFSEVKRRTNEGGIFWFNIMVSHKSKEELDDFFRYSEGSFFSQLYVDENNIIQKVNPKLSNKVPLYGKQWGESLNGNSISLNRKNNEQSKRRDCLY